MDAIEGGGVKLLEMLYEFNREDCDAAIIQLLKQKISLSPTINSFHSYFLN